MGRTYEATHPWIGFTFDLRKLGPVAWIMVGEAESKCEHVAGSPLRPDVARELHAVYLTKGIHGTTSIEGNTLSEEEVRARLEGNLSLPPSREYLGREIDNVLTIYNEIQADVVAGKRLRLTPERIAEFNKRILVGLPVDADVVPGRLRSHSVVVGRYRGAPAEDLPYLMKRFCDWLENDFGAGPAKRMTFTLAVLRAILAHLYLAWIHPFGDGNGRTARLIEFQLMIQAGVPVPSAHVLSDHYNKTRDAYYRALDKTSRGSYPIEDFVTYALEGFVDELREQIGLIRDQQMQVTWENFVHNYFRDQETPAKRRQKHLVLDFPPGKDVAVAEVRRISPRLAEEYAGKHDKTVSRDINELVDMGLLRRTGRADRFVRVNRGIVRAFLPVRAKADDEG